MQWHGDGVVGSLLSLTLDCVLAHRDSGEETQESVKALPADLQDSLDNRLLCTCEDVFVFVVCVVLFVQSVGRTTHGALAN